MVTLTKEQRKAVFKIFQRDFPNWITPFKRQTVIGGSPVSYGGTIKVPSIQYRRFRSKVQPYFDGSGCVMLPWHGMWLGIEKDGYTHS